MVETTTILAHMDLKTAAARKEYLKSMDKFRKEHQSVHERRDFDLYDPMALRNQPQPDIDNHEQRMKHQSNLQQFQGEDLSFEQRDIQQKKQMKIWAQQSAWEREMKKKSEMEEKR